eukprot:478908-Amphidinium_carterae.2
MVRGRVVLMAWGLPGKTAVGCRRVKVVSGLHRLHNISKPSTAGSESTSTARQMRRIAALQVFSAEIHSKHFCIGSFIQHYCNGYAQTEGH